MKLHHLILASGIVFAAGCETTGNTTTADTTTQAELPNSNAASSASGNIGTTATRQDGTPVGTTVPATTQTEFTTRYPTATGVEWKRYNEVAVPIEWDLTDWSTLDKDDYVVRYKVDGNDYYSWYDNTGTWVGTTYAMKDYSKLPAPVNALITSKYSGYTISSAHTENWKNMTAYEVELKGPSDKMKLLVDANGNVIKSKIKPL